MKRTALNLLIDVLAAVCFVGMMATGYLIRFPLPPGSNKNLALWGLTRHQWGGVHFWISLGLLAVVLIHLALHWQWVVSVVARQLRLTTQPHSQHLWSGLIVLTVVAASLGLFAWVAEVSVVERDDPCCPPGEGSGSVVSESSTTRFWMDVYPILETSCLSYHGPHRAWGGFRVDRREDYFRKNGAKPLVVPGKCTESPLIAIVSGQRTDIAMAASHKLTEREVAVLRAWIDAGAEWPETREAR
jgi:hypothetical protein